MLSSSAAQRRAAMKRAVDEFSRALTNAQSDSDVEEVLALIAEWRLELVRNPLYTVGADLSTSMSRLNKILNKDKEPHISTPPPPAHGGSRR